MAERSLTDKKNAHTRYIWGMITMGREKTELETELIHVTREKNKWEQREKELLEQLERVDGTQPKFMASLTERDGNEMLVRLGSGCNGIILEADIDHSGGFTGSFGDIVGCPIYSGLVKSGKLDDVRPWIPAFHNWDDNGHDERAERVWWECVTISLQLIKELNKKYEREMDEIRGWIPNVEKT